MATLVFTAIGTAIGGPVGGAIGALVGGQLDQMLIGSPRREGPRLKELAVSTSSYGTPIPRHFGRMRAAGSIVWATPLKETSEHSGGGKGQPSVTTYSYSASFAVAISSRPILRVGRIWADGNLLRGAAGDLKTAGKLRIYRGLGDQPVDPLIAADRGGACPAFRGLAYCVFESLALGDFGNRIPALTFEVIADEGQIALGQFLEPVEGPVNADRPLDGLAGFSDEGGPLAGHLAALADIYPLACNAGGPALSIVAADRLPQEAPVLPEAAVARDEESFGGAAGLTQRRAAEAGEIPAGLRYYDLGRDYQAGLQRADGRARPGRARVIEFPGALAAKEARRLANAAAERAGRARETLSWRIGELDPALGPGEVVRLPGRPGLWRINAWEWREHGVEMELQRLPRGTVHAGPADAGQALPAPDAVATPTLLVAYELPWDGSGSADARRVFAAASSLSGGWAGAALYLDRAGELLPLGSAGRRRCTIGMLAAPLAPSPALLLEETASFEVELASPDFLLPETTEQELAQGANRVLVGGEVLQFLRAARLEGARWRVSGLLRGRGGTEAAAMAGHAAGAPFVLLDGFPSVLDAAPLGAPASATIAAIGLADEEPVTAPLLNPGLSTRPLTPAHAAAERTPDGGMALSWIRRARGAWTWLDAVDAPLIEEIERYVVGLGDTQAPTLRWETSEPRLAFSAAAWADLAAEHAGEALWVCQLGRMAVSDPLQITTIA